ncbi:MAG: hypothetical protein ACE5G2_07965 [Candidatus Krumholzibacteriia bacterium]
MESAENQVTGNEAPKTSSAPGAVEERARDIGRKVDTASARMHTSWGDATSQVKSRIGTTGERVKLKLQVAGEEAKRKLVVAKDRTATKAKDYRVNVEHQVQAHPLKSLAYAFGAGAVVGLLLGRARR